MAVTCAWYRLDPHEAADALGVSRHQLRFASEADMAVDFAAFEVGAIPPIGPDTPAELIDSRVLDYGQVLCPAGDHEQSLLVDPLDVVRVAGARTLELREESDGRAKRPAKLDALTGRVGAFVSECC